MKGLLIVFLFFLYLKAEDITLQLNWLHQFQFAGYYVAKEKGFYKDVGLNVKIKEYSNSINLVEKLEQNEAQFSVGRSSILIDKYNKKDVVALFAAFQISPLMLLVTDKSISSLEDLRNKQIMLTSHSHNSAALRAMLISQDISKDEIIVQKHSFNLSDLIEGKTKAMGSYLSNEPIILDEKGIDYKIFHPKDYGFELYSDILFTTSSYLEKNPETVKKFYEATIKGWIYAFNNISLTAKLIKQKYNSQNKSLYHLIAEGEELKKLAFDNENNIFGCMETHKLQKIIDIYKVMGFIKGNIDIDSFLYENNACKYLYFNITKEKFLTIVLVAVIVLLFLGFLILYFITKKRWLLTKHQLKEEIDFKTKEIKELSYTDFLTNARNRKAYAEKIEELIIEYRRYRNSFSMILFDIDDFKYINDTFGHDKGDEVLIKLSKLVKETIRESDYFFRVGGEEFIVIFPNTFVDNAYVISDKIRVTIEDNLHEINESKVTISIGLTEIQNNDNEHSIYKRVDELLYKSKDSGKNCIHR